MDENILESITGFDAVWQRVTGREEPAPRASRRVRREHAAVIAGELLSTLAVLAVAAALLVRILAF